MAISCILLAGCSKPDSFTEHERALIGIDPDAGIMRLCTVDKKDDSLKLRKHCEPLSKKDLQSASFNVLKQRMISTVNDPANEGVGIAAPQVGINKQLIAVQRFDKPGEPFEFYINAKITHKSTSTEEGREGCLSVPGKYSIVTRSDTITIEYNDQATFKRASEQIGGFTAVIFQHEIDHINGILYIDRVEPDTIINTTPKED